MMNRGRPVLVLQNSAAKRDVGHRAQLNNIQAAKTVAEIVRTTLGPQSMLKMLLDPMGGIVITNDGNAILREVDVGHPVAKTLIELSRAQDEEVGDGTTSVVILAGEILSVTESLLDKKLHPQQIVKGFIKALADTLEIINAISVPLDVSNEQAMEDAVVSCLGTKISSRWGQIVPKLALQAARHVAVKDGSKSVVEIKKYARVEKIPGGEITDSEVYRGIMINKDVTGSKMRRHIANPRIVLLDCPLEYKKGESALNVEMTKEEDWEKILQQEEDEVRKMCQDIINIGCDVVVTEKGVSDLAQHFLLKAGISAIRRIRKTDNNRLARMTGATIVTRTDELTTNDVGLLCQDFSVKKIGDEYFAFFLAKEAPKACTIILRGGSKDVLNEVERNLHDALGVAKNLLLDARVIPGGGAAEMEIAARLEERREGAVAGVLQWPYRALGAALEVIPRTLLQNCGADVVRQMTTLRAKHAASRDNKNIGVDGHTGQLIDVTEKKIWDTTIVKSQALKTAIEAACTIIRIDDILAGVSKKSGEEGGGVVDQDQPEPMMS